MQYKRIFLALLLPLSFSAAQAQKTQQNLLPASNARVVRIDTIIQQKPATAIPLPLQANAKKPVPLAGQKSYFGSMNDYVEDYTRKYATKNNRTLTVVKKRGENHFSLIDNVLQKHDIPKELKYLAVIESALNNNAISPVGAVGPWQMMASTAKLMGLTVNKKRDERKDMYKSTHAAAKYLNYLYNQLNDWLLVVAAYNSGPTPVQRAIKKTGSNNFWDIKPYLPKETQGHVLAFIATASIFENMNKFIGLGGIPEDVSFSKDAPSISDLKAGAAKAKPAFTDEELKNMAIVRISEPVAFDLLVQDLNMDRKLLDKWNPDYELFEMNTYGGDYYGLRIPKDKLDSFIEKKEVLTKRSKQMYAQMTVNY